MIFVNRPYGRRAVRRGSRGALTFLGAGCLLAVTLPPATPAAAHAGERQPASSAEQRVARHLETVKDQPQKLRALMKALPKGGDLHNHLPGAVSTELLMRLAVEDGLCIEEKTSKAVPAPCPEGARPAADTRTDAAFRQQVLRAWSMQDFPQGSEGESGHDHFFDAFGKFGAVTGPEHNGQMLAEVTNTAAAQHQSYLETMVTPAEAEGTKLAEKTGFDKNLDRMHAKLESGGIDRVVRHAQREADRTEADFRKAAHCDTARPDPVCRVPVRFISQISRAMPNEQVFTQMEIGMRLAERDRRFVAVNPVQPEDDKNSLRNYRLHMRMLDYLHKKYPDAHLTLHAGELTPEIAKPEDLSFHIGEAVRTGHAERIGHGVDLKHEDNHRQLLRTMARRGIAVESPLTSNAQILGVSGKDHPFQTYRKAGVPVVLSTDDPGLSRTDISTEYQRATTTYDLTYPELKDLARASLEHAFLPGRSLWQDRPAQRGYTPAVPCRGEQPGTGRPGPACAATLAASPKARMEWQLERSFAEFEQSVPHKKN